MTSIRKAKKNGTYIKPVKRTLGIDIGIGCSQQTTSYWDGEKWVELQGVSKIHEGEPIIPRLARGGMIPDVDSVAIVGEPMNWYVHLKYPFADWWKKKKKGKRYVPYLYKRGFMHTLRKQVEANCGLSKVMIGDKTIYEREVLGKW